MSAISLAGILSAARRRIPEHQRHLEVNEIKKTFSSSAITPAQMEKASVLLTPTTSDRTLIRELQVLCVAFDSASGAGSPFRPPWWRSFTEKTIAMLDDLLDSIKERLTCPGEQVQADLRILSTMCDALYLALSNTEDFPVGLATAQRVLDILVSADSSDDVAATDEVKSVVGRCKALLCAILSRFVLPDRSPGFSAEGGRDRLALAKAILGAPRSLGCVSYFCAAACAPLLAEEVQKQQAGPDCQRLIDLLLDTLRRSTAPAIPLVFLLQIGEHNGIMTSVLADLAASLVSAFRAVQMNVVFPPELGIPYHLPGLLLSLEPFWQRGGAEESKILLSVAEHIRDLARDSAWPSVNKLAATAMYLHVVTAVLRTRQLEERDLCFGDLLDSSRLSTSCNVSADKSMSSLYSESYPRGSFVLQALRLGEALLARKSRSLSSEAALLLRAIPTFLTTALAAISLDPNVSPLLVGSESDSASSSILLVQYATRFVEFFVTVLPDDSMISKEVAGLAIAVTRFLSADKLRNQAEVMALACSQRRGPLRVDLAFGQCHSALLHAVADIVSRYQWVVEQHAPSWLDVLSCVDIAAHGVESLVWSWVTLIQNFFAALEDSRLSCILAEKAASSSQQLLQKLFLVLLSIHRAFDDGFVLWSASVPVDNALDSVLGLLGIFASCGFHAAIAQSIVQSDSTSMDGDSCFGSLLWLLFDTRISENTARIVSMILIDVAEHAPGQAYTAVRTATNSSTALLDDTRRTYRDQFGSSIDRAIADSSSDVTTVCRLVVLKALIVYETSLYFFIATSGNASSATGEDGARLSASEISDVTLQARLLEIAKNPDVSVRVRAECIELVRRSSDASAGGSRSMLSGVILPILESVVDAMEETSATIEEDQSDLNTSYMSAARRSTRMLSKHVAETPRSARKSGARSSNVLGRSLDESCMATPTNKYHWDEGMLVESVCFVLAADGQKAILVQAAEELKRVQQRNDGLPASPRLSRASETPAFLKPTSAAPREVECNVQRVVELSALVVAQLAHEIEAVQQHLVPALAHLKLSARQHHARLVLGSEYLLTGGAIHDGITNELISLVESAAHALRGVEAVFLSCKAPESSCVRVLESAMYLATLCHPIIPIVNESLGFLLTTCLQCALAAGDACCGDDVHFTLPSPLIEAVVALLCAYVSSPQIAVTGMQVLRLCFEKGFIAHDLHLQLPPMIAALVTALLEFLAQQPAVCVAHSTLYEASATLLDMTMEVWIPTTEHTSLLKRLTEQLWSRFTASLQANNVEMFDPSSLVTAEAEQVLLVLDIVVGHPRTPAVDFLRLEEVLLVARRLGDAAHVDSMSHRSSEGFIGTPVPFAWHRLWCAVLKLLRTFVGRVLGETRHQASRDLTWPVRGFVSTTPRFMTAIRSVISCCSTVLSSSLVVPRSMTDSDAEELTLITSLMLQCYSGGGSVPTEVVLMMKELFILRKGLEKITSRASVILRDALEILLLYEIPSKNHFSLDAVYAVDPHCGQIFQPGLNPSKVTSAPTNPLLTFDLLFRFNRLSSAPKSRARSPPSLGQTLSQQSSPVLAPHQQTGLRSTATSRASSAARSYTSSTDTDHICPSLILILKYAAFYSQASEISAADREALKNLLVGEMTGVAKAIGHGKLDDSLGRFDDSKRVQYVFAKLHDYFGLTMTWDALTGVPKDRR
jgi:hypothetical protein